MIDFACVKWGQKYGPEYVNTLLDMVRRNLPEKVEFRFTCFTDDATGLDPAVTVRELPSGLEGWWGKLWLLSPGVFTEGRVIFMDLDTVIVGGLDQIIAYDGEFAILRDFYRPDGWQSSIMSWRGGFGAHIWERWNAEGCPRFAGGDQQAIEHYQPNADIWQDILPNQFVSYKISCTRQPPRGARVVVFHGEPSPHDAPAEWVKMVWKVGGASPADIEVYCNTQDAALTANVTHALSLCLPEIDIAEAHDEHAVIVGGGPSLANCLDDIAMRLKRGQHIFALNGAAKYLNDAGIMPKYQVLLDARAKNVSLLGESECCLLASQVHPDVFSALGNRPAKLWHSQTEVTAKALGDRPSVLIGGGTTVGLSAMALAFTLGYRKLHLYGFDSSYADTHHAYPQPQNDADPVIDAVAAGRTFKSTAWMVAQVQQFQEFALTLADADCLITVHGDGLLPHVAREMMAGGGDGIVEIDGMWWPEHDRHARGAILGALPDLAHYVSLCPEKRVAVQAGGNVGVWPKELAKHFKEVLTFEPDAVNFACLTRNVTESNVMTFRVALGDELKSVGMARHAFNCGAHQVDGEGDIPMRTIDSLNLEHCDLIQLDIEGHERQALLGAKETIQRCRPVIVLEEKGLGESPRDLLEAWGYIVTGQRARDVIYQQEAAWQKQA